MTQIKEFKIPCSINNQGSTVKVYMGNPDPDHNPISHQVEFLSKERGIAISQEILDTLDKLKEIASENGVPFVELCEYALKSLTPNSTATEITKNNEAVKAIESTKTDKSESKNTENTESI